MKYLKYFWYIVRHKWYVMLACFRYRNEHNGMVWLGIIHDWSKFRLSEFKPYAENFYGNYPSLEEVHGDARNLHNKWQEDVERNFDSAWLFHQNRNKHHWQWWMLPEDDGGIKLLPMPPKYRLEMLCDWLGASAAQGHGKDIISVRKWYYKNNSKMKLYDYTREWIEEQLEIE